MDPGGGVRAAVTTTTFRAPATRNAAAAAASVAPVVATSSTSSTPRRCDASSHEVRAGATRRRGKPGLGRTGSSIEQPQAPGAQLARDGARQDLGRIETPRTSALDGGGRPGDRGGNEAVGERGLHHVRSEPRHDGTGVSVLHPGDELARDASIREGGRPRVDSRREARPHARDRDRRDIVRRAARPGRRSPDR